VSRCADWLAPDNNKWLVPFGAGLGKISHCANRTNRFLSGHTRAF
jgi:hypothetical protein